MDWFKDIANDAEAVRAMRDDPELKELLDALNAKVAEHKWAYNFNWLGRPAIQLPQDIIAMQELLWAVQPDLVIETGVAHGGMLTLYASILELMGQGLAVGVDIEIRPHNRAALESHPLAHRMKLIEGSSTDEKIAAQVGGLAEGAQRVLVVLDSMHTHQHVVDEIALYADLVTPGSYLVVMDTIVEFLPEFQYPDRPWGVGDNPMTAVREFLARDDRFVTDEDFEAKLMFTSSPGGFLKRVK